MELIEIKKTTDLTRPKVELTFCNKDNDDALILRLPDREIWEIVDFANENLKRRK